MEPVLPDFIDLMSDDEDNLDFFPELPFGLVNDAPLPALRPQSEQPTAQEGGRLHKIDGEYIFIPDETEPAAQTLPQHTASLPGREISSFDDCLSRVREVFSDISADHVLKLYHDFNGGDGNGAPLSPASRFERIIDQIVNATSYPKQEKLKKRKRDNSVERDVLKLWNDKRGAPTPAFQAVIRSILKAEFGEIPNNFINTTVHSKKNLFQAYVSLAEAREFHSATNVMYGRGRPSTALADARTIALNSGSAALVDELDAARRHAISVIAEKRLEKAKTEAERENLRAAIELGETTECSACYDDLPMNRQIHCNGPVAHFLCFDCALTYIKTEIGQARCRVLCTAGCGAPFPPDQLSLLSNKQLLAKLANLEQIQAIRDAGLENLEECPGCDFKAILPPVEEDFEFRCLNPECEMVSCRRCKSATHIPLSCEEHAQNNKISSRHKIEEAMTAALVRRCGKCKHQYIKDYGCNKMRCPSCKNVQCYVCSASNISYDHFEHEHPGGPNLLNAGPSTSKKCPLYDNVEERHDREVKEAEAKAREQVAKENPHLNADDLEIKTSEAVKKADANRAEARRGDAHGLLDAPNHAIRVRADLARIHNVMEGLAGVQAFPAVQPAIQNIWHGGRQNDQPYEVQARVAEMYRQQMEVRPAQQRAMVPNVNPHVFQHHVHPPVHHDRPIAPDYAPAAPFYGYHQYPPPYNPERELERRAIRITANELARNGQRMRNNGADRQGGALMNAADQLRNRPDHMQFNYHPTHPQGDLLGPNGMPIYVPGQFINANGVGPANPQPRQR